MQHLHDFWAFLGTVRPDQWAVTGTIFGVYTLCVMGLTAYYIKSNQKKKLMKRILEQNQLSDYARKHTM